MSPATAYLRALSALRAAAKSDDLVGCERELLRADIGTLERSAAILGIDTDGNAPREDLDGWDCDRLDHGAHDDLIYSGRREWKSDAELRAVLYGRPSRRALRGKTNAGHTRGWAHRNGAERFPVVTGPDWRDVLDGFKIVSVRKRA